MENCLKCGILNRITGNNSDVYISASEGYLFQKTIDTLRVNGYTFREIATVVFVENIPFQGLVNCLFHEPGLSDAEKGHIQLVPLVVGEHFTPQHLFAFKTLKAWYELLSSKYILDVISQRRIKTFFQPIFDATNSEVFAFECLSRGVTEGGNIIPPVELFQKASALELQFALDRATRERAIENAACIGITQQKVFINFLPTAIYNPKDCLQGTIQTAERYNLNPQNLVFEVVESEQVKDLSHLNSILTYYKQKGFQCALDDFGSGYSSLKMLDELSPDYIKIDMHFIRDIDQNTFKQSVVRSIVALAKAKGTKVLAEGIETQGEFETVRGIGVDLVQGYLFARPSEDISQFLGVRQA